MTSEDEKGETEEVYYIMYKIHPLLEGGFDSIPWGDLDTVKGLFQIS